jgi:Fe-S-cluster containining protein
MIKQVIPKEYCLKCKGCCRYSQRESVWSPCLLDDEIQALVDKDIPCAYISMERKIMPVPSGSMDGFICPFLKEEDNRCQIYDARPFECQIYPFLINLRGKKALLTVDLNCPYIADYSKTNEFKEYVEFLAGYLNSAEQIKILKENPQIIQAYESVLDLIELEATNEDK